MRSVPILLVAAALGVSLFAAAPARADTLAITQNLFGPDGWPIFVVNANPQGANGTQASWQVCSPDCGPVVAQGAQFEAGPVAPGATIQASYAVGGAVLTATSKPWVGRVAATAPPTVAGTPRIGSTVLPVGVPGPAGSVASGACSACEPAEPRPQSTAGRFRVAIRPGPRCP